GIRDFHVTGVQTCALPIYAHVAAAGRHAEVVEVDRPGLDRAAPDQGAIGIDLDHARRLDHALVERLREGHQVGVLVEGAGHADAAEQRSAAERIARHGDLVADRPAPQARRLVDLDPAQPAAPAEAAVADR